MAKRLVEMHTCPVSDIVDIGESKPPASFAQTFKDWVAERASNVLLNRLYPEKGSSSSSSEYSEDEDDESELDQLQEVVVTEAPTIYSSKTVPATIQRPSLAEHRNSSGGGGEVPIISVRECTPASESSKKRERQKLRVKIEETSSTASGRKKGNFFTCK